MQTDTFDTTSHMRQTNHQGARHLYPALTLLGVSVLTFGLVSALLAMPASAKSGRGSSGDSSYQYRYDDNSSSNGHHDRDDDQRHGDDDDRNKNRGQHHDRNNRHDDDDHEDRHDDRDDHSMRHSSRGGGDNDKMRIYGQVTHVDDHSFTVRTSDGASHTFMRNSSNHKHNFFQPRENDYVRVDHRTDPRNNSLKVTRDDDH